MQLSPFFGSRSDFKSFADYSYWPIEHGGTYLYDYVEVLKSLLDDLKQIFCGGLLKMIKWKRWVLSAIGVQLFPCFLFISDVYKSFIDLYILEFTEMKCVEVLKSLSDDQKQKFCDGNLEDINFPTNQNISFNIFSELLKIAKALASNRNIAIKNMLNKINSDVSDAVNVSSPVKKKNKNEEHQNILIISSR